ncbi:CubicO group peptidase (beta-lactamase class C family) [Agromyces terreus]|uniref:CubicO group peptidase (Beta-lactamase class C family) n=1 Tax=Agromyces terreus TaxID=424795 RepID=A0A9X2H3H9_9MICO|nr:serine hydrolase [Agromyces terreus]MCP2370127.1 CubicO group peptidase (beta-lactamase class C family) [Agromyces terreus]
MAHRRTRPLAAAVALTAVALTAVALAACAPDPEPYAPRVASDGPPPVDAVQVPDGSIDAAVEELPGDIAKIMDTSGIPGVAVAVVHGDEVLFAEGFGVRELGEPAKVDADTVFQIASMSKPIAATVVASQLGDELGWDTPAAPLLPGFSLQDPWVTEHVTVGDLFAHRSGLPPAAGDDLEDVGYDRDYILGHLDLQPLNPFRTAYGYANFGLTAGAEAVANAVGTDWETLSDEALYDPLGMDSTSSRYDDFLAEDDRAVLHTLERGEFTALYQRDADAQTPAGGVSSSVNDLAKWLTLLIGDGMFDGQELVDPDALLPAITPQIVSSHSAAPDHRAGSYGFGFNTGTDPTGHTTFSHSGAFSLGGSTNFQVVPALDLGVVAITNGAPIGVPEAIVSTFLDRVQFGEVHRDWLADYGQALAHYTEPAGDLAGQEAPTDAAAPGRLDGYAGTWTNPYFGEAVVTVEGDALVARLGPDGAYVLDLEPWDGDTFAYVPTGENAPWGSLASAAFTLDGVVDTMNLQFFDANGLGTWTRLGIGTP